MRILQEENKDRSKGATAEAETYGPANSALGESCGAVIPGSSRHVNGIRRRGRMQSPCRQRANSARRAFSASRLNGGWKPWARGHVSALASPARAASRPHAASPSSGPRPGATANPDAGPPRLPGKGSGVPGSVSSGTAWTREARPGMGVAGKSSLLRAALSGTRHRSSDRGGSQNRPLLGGKDQLSILSEPQAILAPIMLDDELALRSEQLVAVDTANRRLGRGLGLLDAATLGCSRMLVLPRHP